MDSEYSDKLIWALALAKCLKASRILGIAERKYPHSKRTENIRKVVEEYYKKYPD